jgi:CRP/FNR family transcriptional regulator
MIQTNQQTRAIRIASHRIISAARAPFPTSAGPDVGDKKAYVPGTTIFRNGDKSAWIYEIQAGTVALAHFSSDGRRQIVGFSFPGDLVGASSEGAYFHDAHAVSQVEVRRIPQGLTPQIIRRNPLLGLRIQQMMPALMSSFMTQLTMIAQHSAEARMAAFILSIAGRIPYCRTNGHDFMILEMSREDIGDYVGLAVETVCRAFARLEHKGLIAFKNAHLLGVSEGDGLERVVSHEL